MILVYAPYGTHPSTKNIKTYSIWQLENIDIVFYKNIVIEYEFIKKITYVALPLFIIITATSFIDHNIKIPQLLLTESPFTTSFSPSPISIYEILSSLWVALFFVISDVLLRMLFWHGRKELRYYFAKGCAEISKYGNNVKRMRYLILSLNSYNKYLQRYLKMQINDNVFSLIANKVLIDENELTNISSTFESDDELSAVKYLSKSIKLSEGQFLVKSRVTVRQIIIE